MEHSDEVSDAELKVFCDEMHPHLINYWGIPLDQFKDRIRKALSAVKRIDKIPNRD